jgi:predicted transcriptional regulator
MDKKPLIDALERRAFAARTPIYLLCKRAGVSSATFSNWRSGKVNPTLVTLEKVEKAMDDIEKERRG